MRIEHIDGRSSGQLDLPISSPRHLKEEALNGLPHFSLADTPLASTSEQQPSTSVSQSGPQVRLADICLNEGLKHEVYLADQGSHFYARVKTFMGHACEGFLILHSTHAIAGHSQYHMVAGIHVP